MCKSHGPESSTRGAAHQLSRPRRSAVVLVGSHARGLSLESGGRHRRIPLADLRQAHPPMDVSSSFRPTVVARCRGRVARQGRTRHPRGLGGALERAPGQSARRTSPRRTTQIGGRHRADASPRRHSPPHHAARRSPSTCRNHASRWFLLTKIWLTSLHSRICTSGASYGWLRRRRRSVKGQGGAHHLTG
jgi:hypothetical protein